MSEVYTRTTTQSAGSNLMESIKSFLVGIVLFLASFVVLYWNEGRTDMSEVAKRSAVVAPDNPGSTGEGKLISVTGDLKVDESVGDPDLLVPGHYVKLHRKVEMYSWKEKYEKKTEKKLGGGSVTTETATYDKVWQENPPNSDNFKVPKGHRNPKPSIQSQTFYAAHAKVGALSFSPKETESTGELEGGGLPPSDPVVLTAAMVKGGGAQGPKAPPKPAAKPGPSASPSSKATAAPHASASAAPSASPDGDDDSTPQTIPGGSFKLVSGYLFRGWGTPDDSGAKLGDIRISFQAVNPGKQVTLFGKRSGTTVTTYVNSDNDKLLRVVLGTRDKAIAQMHGEHQTLTWIFRLVGFICMWSGLGMILSPINAVLDIVPIIGSAGRVITSIAMFPVALVLSVLTIMVSIVAHSPILLVLVILVIGGGITALIMMKRKKAAAAQPQVAPAGGMPPMGYQGGPPPDQGGYGPPPGGGMPPQGGGYGGPPPGGGYGGPPPGGGYGGPPPGGGYGGPPPGGGYGGPPPA